MRKARNATRLGVLLVSVFLFGLVPWSTIKLASANPGKLIWTIVDTPAPNQAEKNIIVNPSEINTIAIGWDDLTSYAVDIPTWHDDDTDGLVDPNETGKIYKSKDGGVTWSDSLTANLIAGGASLPVWNVAVATEDVNFVVAVTDGTGVPNGPKQVFISRDGGDTWEPTPTLLLGVGEYISCVDISIAYDKRDIAIGTRDGTGTGKVYVLKVPGLTGWIDQTIAPSVGWTNSDVIALKFSPNYDTDLSLIVISSTAAGTIINLGIRDIFANSTAWNNAVNYPVTIVDIHYFGNSPNANQIITADLELPSNFSGTDSVRRKYYVNIDSVAVLTQSGVYRIDDTVAYRILSANNRISSIAYWDSYDNSGNLVREKLLAGEVTADVILGAPEGTVNIWRTSESSASYPAWESSNNGKPPTGGANSGYANAQLAWNSDGRRAYCATSSADFSTGGTSMIVNSGCWPEALLNSVALDESAFSVSPHATSYEQLASERIGDEYIDVGKVWNQLSLIDTEVSFLSDVAALEVPEDSNNYDVLYLASINNAALPGDTDFDSIWRSTSTPLGKTWERVLCTATVDDHLIGIWGSAANNVFTVGRNGVILRYNGMVWVTVSSGTTNDLIGIWGSAANDIFAVGENGTILHYDGISWSSTTVSSEDLNGVWGSAGNNVFAVGEWDANILANIFHYNGFNWNTMVSGTTNELWSTWGSAPNDVFAIGESGTILHYNGANWNAMVSGTTNDLSGVWGSAANDVFAVGENGSILHYNGANWNAMVSGTANNLRDTWGSAANDIFAVGENGSILHYNGANWNAMVSGTTNDLSGVWGSAANDVFAVGKENTILHYNGANWRTMTSGTTTDNEIILRVKPRLPEKNTRSKVIVFADRFTNHVGYSEDEGQEWQPLNTGAHYPGVNITVTDLTLDSSDIMYILDDTVVCRYEDWSLRTRRDTNLDSGHTIAVPLRKPDGEEEWVIVGECGPPQGQGKVAYADFSEMIPEFEPPPAERIEVPVPGNIHVIADDTFDENNIIYAASHDLINGTTGKIYRWTIDESTAWDELEPPNSAFYGLVQSNDVLYGAWDATTPPDTPPGADRTLYARKLVPPAPEWDDLTEGLPVPGDTNYPVSFTREPSSLKISSNAGNNLWAIDNRNYDWANEIGCLWTYADPFAKVGPWTTSPASNDFVPCDPVSGRANEVNFRWRHMSYAQAYELQLAKNDDFSIRILGSDNITPVSPLSPACYFPAGGLVPVPASEIANSGNLECGHAYYWRVRARRGTSGETIRSPWSATMFFTVKAGFPVQTEHLGSIMLKPTHGAKCVSRSPSFSWSPIAGTTKYEFILAKDAALTEMIANVAVPGTAYKHADKLDWNTTYFWQVKSLEPIVDEPSPVASFTVRGQQMPVPPSTTTPPASSPFWIWIAITVYVALVVAIIILIKTKPSFKRHENTNTIE